MGGAAQQWRWAVWERWDIGTKETHHPAGPRHFQGQCWDYAQDHAPVLQEPPFQLGAWELNKGMRCRVGMAFSWQRA